MANTTQTTTKKPSNSVRRDGEKVVAITGGSQGIGLAIAERFAAAGYCISISARTEDTLQSAAKHLHRVGGRILAVQADVQSPESMEMFTRRTLGEFGRIDAVIANAGVAGPVKPLHEITYSEWRECVGINLDGVYVTFRGFAAHMIDSGTAGSLIAISSAVGKRPLVNRTPYAAAKMGVIGLVRTLAHELGPYNIRANSICPGSVEGERLERVLQMVAETKNIDISEARRQFLDPTALKRAVRGVEIANACFFLAQDASSGITGEDLNVSAGLVTY